MRFRFLSLLALLGVFTFVAAAADVSGTYKAEVPGRNGNTQPLTIVLKADGMNLTGNLTNARGDTPITDGKVDGNNVSFNVVRKMQDNEITIKYKGKVEGDSIKFTQSMSFNGNDRTVEFVAKKQ
jgi:hypothetical protein